MTDLDVAFADIGDAKLDPAKLGPDWLPNGYYTLAFPCGTHRTLRVYTRGKGMFAGRRLVALLIGPDNTTDYEDFGTVEPTGIKVWKRFANAKQAEYAQLLWDMAGGEKIEDHDLIVSRRCLVCNRPLTTPDAVKFGIGEVCRERLGL